MGYLKRKSERCFALLTYKISSDLHWKAKNYYRLVKCLRYRFASGPRQQCAEWLVTTWIYLTRSPITVLLPQVMVSLPQGTPTVWTALVTSKKPMDGGTVHFRTTNEFSGVDLTLRSPAQMVIWMRLMSLNIAAVGEQTSHTVTSCEMSLFVYYWIPINSNIEHTTWDIAALQTKTSHTKHFRVSDST